MMTQRIWRGVTLAAVGLLTLATLAPAADRPADKILDEIRGVQMPQIGNLDQRNQEAVQAFIAKRQAAMERKAALIGELYQQHPATPELVQLMPERWQALLSVPKSAKQAEGEMNQVIAAGKNDKLVVEASFLKVLVAFRKAGQGAKAEDLAPTIEEFTKRFPKDPRGAEMFAVLAKLTTDEAKKAAYTQRIEKDYPDSPMAAMAASERRVREAVGKPFPIEFVDAIKGTKVDSASLKGKVVILDFWATWCLPCVREMPKMKELYAKYKDKGVEFVGVSLDAPKEEGGLDKLKAFVAENKIPWPQYYQGNGWESEFSKSWGINSIPAVFAIGADGKLASTDARDKLKELIPELLDKAKTTANP